MTKTCTFCGEEKDISSFGSEKRNKDGKRANCKDCQAKYMKEYIENNKDKIYSKNIDNYYKNSKERREKQRIYESNKRNTTEGKISIRNRNRVYINNKLKSNKPQPLPLDCACVRNVPIVCVTCGTVLALLTNLLDDTLPSKALQ